MNKYRLLLPAVLLLLGVLAAWQMRQAAPPEVVRKVDFESIDWFARRAQAAYADPAKIRAEYPDTVFVGSPAHTEVLYFLETRAGQRRHIVSVRGTDNLENALQDAEYLRAEDSELGIAVHRGFDADTRVIYADLKPRLDPQYDIYLTGHSLGAAVSTLLMMYLQKDGFRVVKSVNFGQPKITNKAGALVFQALPLTRVIDGKDVVPLLPADTPLDSEGGEYTHLGRTVILLDGPFYAYLSGLEAEQVSQGSFWRDFGDESVQAHKVANYRKRISGKIDGSEEVPFPDRYDYLQQ
ncbi:MAG: lipase family protein [Halieaceae bacterium]|jgi:hypothetical protein|nr:lipase family protein [Halieaceae bacterium]